MSQNKYFNVLSMFSSWCKPDVFSIYGGYAVMNYDLMRNYHSKEVTDMFFNGVLNNSAIGKHAKILFADRDKWLDDQPHQHYADSMYLAHALDKQIHDAILESSIETLDFNGITIGVIGKVILFTNKETSRAIGYVTFDDEEGNETLAVPFATANARDWEKCLNSFFANSVSDFIFKQASDRVAQVS